MTDFRDLDCEQLVTGHVLTWPQDLAVYRQAGLSVEDFTDGNLRLVWAAIAEIERAGCETDERSVRNLAVPKGVTPPFFLRLTEGVPRLPRENIQLHAERLATLRRCREFARGEQLTIAQLAERPDLINTGLLEHRIGQIARLQHTASDRDFLIDDVALLELPPPIYLVDGRLVTGSLAALVGPPGAGKTFCALDLALSVATGRPWLGARVTISGPVIYVAAEGVAGLQSRVRAWKTAYHAPLDEPCGLQLYPQAVSLLDSAAVTAFLKATKRAQPVLVVFDTLARCMVGGDENSALDMGRVIAAADHVRVNLGATVLFLHHTTKAGGSERGSSALRGALDTLLALNPADDVLTLSVEKQKDAPPFAPIELKLDALGESCVIRPTREVLTTTDLSPAQAKCLRALRLGFPRDVGATGPQWLELLPELNRRTFYTARASLHRKGFVTFKGTRNLSTDKPEPFEDGSESVHIKCTPSAIGSAETSASEIPKEISL